MLQRISFFGSIGVLYVLTIGTIGGLLYSSHLFGTPVWAKTEPLLVKQPPAPPTKQVISGKPIRISIPDSNIDLSVSDGIYIPSDNSWTLTDTSAQYAVISALANDHAGTTFIYGHGTDAVFGKIGTNHPPAGTVASVATDTGHTFTYRLETVRDFQPSDTSIFDDTASGPARLIIQTCTGIFSEWRTMFIFTFERVDS